ncbi:MAG: hypothetical protein ABR541_07995 [Candidatus Dormibacteria bacterium]
MTPEYDPTVIRPLAGLSASQSGTAERLGLTADELKEHEGVTSEGFAQLLGAAMVRYDEAVGELSLYP